MPIAILQLNPSPESRSALTSGCVLGTLPDKLHLSWQITAIGGQAQSALTAQESCRVEMGMRIKMRPPHGKFLFEKLPL